MLKRIWAVLAILLAVSSLLVANIANSTESSKSTNPRALILEVDGAISPATSDFMVRGVSAAAKQGASLVIIQLDTPGGLDKSMRSVIKAILASAVPVVTYVAPSGARAASAGTFMLYASHIAAMAPGTNLGAASPVSIGGSGRLPNPSSDNKDKNKQQSSKQTNKAKSDKQATKQPASQQETSKQKVTNDAVAYIRSLAQLRKRNIDFAEKAVTQAATLTAREAKQQNVIDIVATDINDLLKQLNSKTVQVKGAQQKLDTTNIQLVKFEPDWRMKFLSVITDPSVAYILLLIGIYGLFFEFANPGFIVPGVAGGIALLLALYAFQLLPISYAGLGLIILGIMFMVAEAFVPSFGALGLGGVIAFVVGSVMLLDSDLPGFQLALPLIIAMAAINALFFFLTISMAMRARRKRVVSGRESLIGLHGEVMADFTERGQAKISGEIWQVNSDQPLQQGDKIRVISSDGLLLKVEIIK